MSFTADEKDEIKRMVMWEIEADFTELSHKFNTKENHDKMLYLLDIESAVKAGLMKADSQNEESVGV